MTDFDEVVLLGEEQTGQTALGVGRGCTTSHGDHDTIPATATDEIVEVVRLPPSPEPIGGRRCPCKCHQANSTTLGGHQQSTVAAVSASNAAISGHVQAIVGTSGGGGPQKGPAEEHHKLANRDRHCVECAIRVRKQRSSSSLIYDV